MKYHEIRKELKTGDLVLFSGSGLVSNIIKAFTGSRWSHIGMVVMLQEYDFAVLWESTTLSKSKDLSTGSFKKGVQLAQLSDRINGYDGDIAFRLLNKKVSEYHENELMKFRRLVNSRKYETSYAELLKSAYDGPWGDNHEDLSSLFCSELVAQAYKQMSLIDLAKPSNEYTPADFERFNEFKFGFKLSELVYLSR